MSTDAGSLATFFDEHRRCGRLETGKDAGHVWMTWGTHEIMQALGQEPRDTRFLLWPTTVRLMLATFMEDMGGQEGTR